MGPNSQGGGGCYFITGKPPKTPGYFDTIQGPFSLLYRCKWIKHDYLVILWSSPMKLNPIGLAIPFFLGLMLLEVFIAKKRQKDVYRLNDAMTDIGSGMGDQALGIFFSATNLALLTFFADHLALGSWAMDDPWTWVISMIGVDFIFYWYHRFSHRVNWAWATHAVHHHSEYYNLAVALRQPFFAKYYSWAFYVPMVVFGIPPLVIMGSLAFNLLYQFWIHTQLIGKMGAFEWVFNTPSHHRVHHGTNPQYIDKNYAGILIIWDRMFGTFALEEEEVRYGTIKPVRSWSAVWSNFTVIQELWRKSRRQKNIWNAIKLWWMPPEWDPTQKEEVELGDRGYNANHSPHLNWYLSSQVLLAGGVMAVLMLFGQSIPQWVSIAGVGWVFCSILAWGGLFENKTWGKALELLKFAIPLAIASAFVLQNTTWQWAHLIISSLCLFYLGWFFLAQQKVKDIHATS